MDKIYYCYLLISGKKTYIGITNNLKKRIKNHNGKNGAKSTRGMKTWTYHTIVGKFNSRGSAQRFEYYWKHIKNKKNKWVRNKSGIINKMKRLLVLLFTNEWIDISLIKNI